MSRVAKQPIALPKGVDCQVGADSVTIKGPKGTLKWPSIAGVKVVLDNGVLDNGRTLRKGAGSGERRAGLSAAQPPPYYRRADLSCEEP